MWLYLEIRREETSGLATVTRTFLYVVLALATPRASPRASSGDEQTGLAYEVTLCEVVTLEPAATCMCTAALEAREETQYA